MYYYLLQFCFGGVYLRWCLAETGNGFVKYIEERHEHTQKIIKRILHFCGNHQGNTSESALNYLDKKILLGVQEGFYDFLKIMKDSNKHYTSTIASLNKIINDTHWMEDMNPITRKLYDLLWSVGQSNNIPDELLQFNDGYLKNDNTFFHSVHSTLDEEKNIEEPLNCFAITHTHFSDQCIHYISVFHLLFVFLFFFVKVIRHIQMCIMIQLIHH